MDRDEILARIDELLSEASIFIKWKRFMDDSVSIVVSNGKSFFATPYLNQRSAFEIDYSIRLRCMDKLVKIAEEWLGEKVFHYNILREEITRILFGDVLQIATEDNFYFVKYAYRSYGRYTEAYIFDISLWTLIEKTPRPLYERHLVSSFLIKSAIPGISHTEYLIGSTQRAKLIASRYCTGEYGSCSENALEVIYITDDPKEFRIFSAVFTARLNLD